MGYFIDMEKISIDDYRIRLMLAYLPPSRLILKDNLIARFEYFKSIGINNIKELTLLLKNENKFALLSNIEIFSNEYLTILQRELKSIHPKPNKFIDFVEIREDTIKKLEKAGLSNTEKLYNKVFKFSDRKILSESIEINYADILKLTKLADLSRIKWVGVTYAQLLYNLGVDTVDKISKSDPVELHVKINWFIKDTNVFKGAIGLNDVKILIEFANYLSLDIEY